MNYAVQSTETEAERALREHFDAIASELPGADDAAFAKLRSDAMARFAKLGLPHRRIEEWKYTDLKAAIKEAYPPAKDAAEPIDENDIYDVLGRGFDELLCYRIVVAEGRLVPELSHIDGLGDRIEIRSLREAVADDDRRAWVVAELEGTLAPDNDPVVALNTALMSDGAVIRVAEGAEINRPIHVVFVTGATEPETVSLRNLIEVGVGARATILETYSTRRTPQVLRNSVTQVRVGAEARLAHIKLQNQAMPARDLATWMVRLHEGAQYRGFQFTIGSALSRNQIYLRFEEPGASAHLAGATMLWDEQHSDTTLFVDHAAPECTSRELFKYVLDDRARGVFQGKVSVKPGAQKTDGKQMAQGLLLGQFAEFDSKPELEIFADDVVCGHGSTSGQIDETQLFYLRARGLPEEVARAFLIQAFIGEALAEVENEEIREALRMMAAAWLSHSRA